MGAQTDRYKQTDVDTEIDRHSVDRYKQTDVHRDREAQRRWIQTDKQIDQTEVQTIDRHTYGQTISQSTRDRQADRQRAERGADSQSGR